MRTKTLLLFLFLLMSVVMSAQPGCPTQPAPIGFIEILIGGGMVAGSYYKLKNRKK